MYRRTIAFASTASEMIFTKNVTYSACGVVGPRIGKQANLFRCCFCCCHSTSHHSLTPVRINCNNDAVPASVSGREKASQRRMYSSSSMRCSRQYKEYYKLRNRHKPPQQDPFLVLGFNRKKHKQRHPSDESNEESNARDQEESDVILYTKVKAAFLKIAMQHHPDTNNAETEQEEEEHKNIFLKARAAFEQIVQGPDGRAILRSESDEYGDGDVWQEDEFNNWFHDQTGHDMPYMDYQTMKEVAEMNDQIGGGLDRDGGMWDLARMVSRAVKQGGDARDLLRLEAGEARDRNIDGELRRRRRR